jgi:hypothetical protein
MNDKRMSADGFMISTTGVTDYRRAGSGADREGEGARQDEYRFVSDKG